MKWPFLDFDKDQKGPIFGYCWHRSVFLGLRSFMPDEGVPWQIPPEPQASILLSFASQPSFRRSSAGKPCLSQRKIPWQLCDPPAKLEMAPPLSNSSCSCHGSLRALASSTLQHCQCQVTPGSLVSSLPAPAGLTSRNIFQMCSLSSAPHCALWLWVCFSHVFRQKCCSLVAPKEIFPLVLKRIHGWRK